MSEDHPFAQYVRALGKGPNMWRDLDFEESKDAMSMILKGEAEPLQIGAFLLLLRRKGETGEEFAGMAAAAKALFEADLPNLKVDYDWPSYADRHRQQPWFVLAAILLADQGYKILMHGIEGYSEGYAPTRPALECFKIPEATSLSDLATLFQDQNLVYLGLEKFCPELQALFELRPYLGVRTAVNTFARDLNPLNAPCQLQGVFHPPYKAGHLQTAKILGQENAMIFKGGGGEVMRNPMKEARVDALLAGEETEIVWPALTDTTTYKWREEDLTSDQVLKLWRGDISLPVPEKAIIGTLSVALKMKNPDESVETLDRMATEIWENRDRDRF
ncbi:glycosyl transferase family protein [Sneathiella limimaris]|uniref:glycosyl transferase family protein n=1 Tax=Sneathiella limimaris TaxID=1964213 RepID=UPI00146EC3F6|nr:glycosyl transferase family protein [Sneathiella limimaris]